MISLIRLGSALVFAASLAAGCSHRSATGATQLIVGLDTSGSNRAQLPQQARLASQLVTRLDPARDRLILLRLDCAPSEFYNGPVPDSGARLNTLLVRELAPSARRPGTSPERFWEFVAERSRQSRLPALAVLFTDGERDDTSPEATARLSRAVTRLARAQRLRRVCLWGVKPSERHRLRQELAPLSDRVEICGIADLEMERTLALAAVGPDGPGWRSRK